MSVLTMMAPLLSGVELTPGQLAELRAIDTLYHTRRATQSGEPNECSFALDDTVLTRVRDMLRDDQRAMFDRNREARQPGQARESDRSGRHR
jgi:hypothetical protein